MHMVFFLAEALVGPSRFSSYRPHLKQQRIHVGQKLLPASTLIWLSSSRWPKAGKSHENGSSQHGPLYIQTGLCGVIVGFPDPSPTSPVMGASSDNSLWLAFVSR